MRMGPDAVAQDPLCRPDERQRRDRDGYNHARYDHQCQRGVRSYREARRMGYPRSQADRMLAHAQRIENDPGDHPDAHGEYRHITQQHRIDRPPACLPGALLRRFLRSALVLKMVDILRLDVRHVGEIEDDRQNDDDDRYCRIGNPERLSTRALARGVLP